MTVTLSIIVPVYNVEAYLNQCTDSILNQSFTDFELILVDDGSTDRSAQICDEYAEKDERVRVIHQKNGGCVSARKTGLLAARGKYAAYVDSDDWLSRNMFEIMVGKMEEYGCDLVMCDFDYEHKALPFSSGAVDTTVSGGYYDRKSLEEKIFPRMLYSGNFFEFGVPPVIWSKVYKRELLMKYQSEVWDSIKTGEDVACVFPYLLDAESMYYIKGEPLYHYRRSDSQMTTAYDPLYFKTIKTLYSFLTQSSIARSPYAHQLDYYYAYVMKLSVSNEIKAGKKLSFSEKIRHIKDICAFTRNEGFAGNLTIKEPYHRLYILLLRKGKAFPLYIAISSVKAFQRLLGRRK